MKEIGYMLERNLNRGGGYNLIRVEINLFKNSEKNYYTKTKIKCGLSPKEVDKLWENGYYGKKVIDGRLLEEEVKKDGAFFGALCRVFNVYL